MRFQITKSSVVKLFLDEFHDDYWSIKEWGSCMKRVGTKSGKKKQIWANFRSCTGTSIGLYRYTPSRSQSVPIQVQAVPVHPNRMQPVPVQVKGVPV